MACGLPTATIIASCSFPKQTAVKGKDGKADSPLAKGAEHGFNDSRVRQPYPRHLCNFFR